MISSLIKIWFHVKLLEQVKENYLEVTWVRKEDTWEVKEMVKK